MLTMYPGMVNSPITELAAAIDETQTTIEVIDGTKLPDAPNLAIIGLGEDAETILYTEKTGNILSGVTRGFQGVAKAWGQGARIARFFTEYDQRAMMQNIQENADNLASHLNDFAQVWSNRIVEMGENANGTYIRWENGLQVCFAGINVVQWGSQTTADQGPYYSTEYIWAFPAVFIDTNVTIVSNPRDGGTANVWSPPGIYVSHHDQNKAILWLWTSHQRDDVSNGFAIAIGRWK